jgi:DNA-directed RNA polymerase subunit N (RpoN/RPB10)
MVEVKNGPIYCVRCGKAVAVEEKPGDTSKAQMPDVLIGQCGHVIAERPDEYSAWQVAA